MREAEAPCASASATKMSRTSVSVLPPIEPGASQRCRQNVSPAAFHPLIPRPRDILAGPTRHQLRVGEVDELVLGVSRVHGDIHQPGVDGPLTHFRQAGNWLRVAQCLARGHFYLRAAERSGAFGPRE